MTVADLVIAALADENARLYERIMSLETDAAVYRELGQAAIDALQHLTVQHKALQATYHRLRDEQRALHEQILLADEHLAA